MRINKCNLCGKVLEDNKDKYYSISDISFHNPNSKHVEMHFSKTENWQENREAIQSWTNYCDLDFCEPCWDKVGLKRFL